ncbi:uncharacterized protein LOC128221845 [Mya arenaria]|uniref:uncharacterized protein LOC128221845 n=1 Tax=Mya arenaria TaxID=6604 RepID=UPI0022E5755B|nr:uncharacterized protein LOC128221845 [Mya arenaria]
MSFAAFNGKAAELNERVFKLLESACLPIKENGTTLVSQGSVPFYDTFLVIHKPEKPWTDDTTAEKIKVQLEERFLHYAIVPQVAYHRNEQTVRFVSPYFRGGSLEKAIQKETDKIQDKQTAKPQTLDLNEKLRILYQICCAIQYLHEQPDCDRNVTHGDISLKRILLDEQKNARLLFFTPSSFEGDKKFTHEKSKDEQDFIKVLFAVLKGTPGREAEKLLKYASDKDVTLKKISDKLEGLVGRNNIDRWTRSQDAKKKCEICCVNEPEPFCNELHHSLSCKTKIQMCVGCMRNWQYNPVKCHSCDQAKIQSPVGDGWGALLIAGTDEENPYATKQFENDIAKMEKNVITDVTVMGIRKEKVITVKKSTTNYTEQLDNAFRDIDTQGISTLVLVYSGHHFDARFNLDSGKENDEKLVRRLKNLVNVNKIVLFLDCCFPERLNLSGKIVLQLNAVKSSEHALFDTEGSQYINEIVQAVTKPWECTCCKNTSILVNSNLQVYLSRHIKRFFHTKPSNQTDTGQEIDHILAFRPVGSGWLDALEKKISESSLIGK